jgi:predicted HTH transcriptional regulator
MPIEEARKPGSSDPRNETLLRMFSMIDVGERAGSGMDKIFNGWAWAGYGEPAYAMERNPDRTTLTLPLKEESDNYRQIESSDSNEGKMDMRAGRTAQNKRAIAEYLTMNGPSKSSDIAAAVGLKITRTNQILREMIAAGTVQAEGQARNREYRLSE